MKHWTIGKRITVGFGTLITLVLAVGIMNVVLLRSVETRLHNVVDDAMPGMNTGARLALNTAIGQLAVVRHMLASTSREKEVLEKQRADAEAAILKLYQDYEPTISRPEDRALFEKCRQAGLAYSNAGSAVLGLSRSNAVVEADSYDETAARPAYEASQAAALALFKGNSDFSFQAAADIRKTLNRTHLLMVVSLSIVAILGATLSFVIVMGVKRALDRVASAIADGSTQVAAAAGQVASSSQSLAEGASEQAASLEETSSSLEEMSSMTGRNTENADKVNALAREARQAADNGSSDMQAMATAMNDIRESGNDIAKIIKTIDEIAFQTNILALNAAVEAARAGEAGMGFAVVADEVRNLAQRAATSAKETSAKIDNAVARTSQGVLISEKVGTSLHEIVARARGVDELASQVATASREQSQGIQQISLAVNQMDKVTQSNAANAEQSASAAEELSAQAHALKEAVAELQRLAGSEVDVSLTPAPRTAQPNSKIISRPQAALSNGALRGRQNGSPNGHPETDQFDAASINNEFATTL